MQRARVRRDPRQLPKIVKKKRQQVLRPAEKKRQEVPGTVSRERQKVLRPAGKKRQEALRIVSSARRAAATEELRAAAMADLLRHRGPGETDATEELRAAELTGHRIPARAAI